MYLTKVVYISDIYCIKTDHVSDQGGFLGVNTLGERCSLGCSHRGGDNSTGNILILSTYLFVRTVKLSNLD